MQKRWVPQALEGFFFVIEHFKNEKNEVATRSDCEIIPSHPVDG